MDNRTRMTREERAKQFMPFSALKGYEAALRQKEKIIVPRMELSEEYREILDQKLRQVEKNDMITVVYFCRNEYLELTGMVSRLDLTARILQIVNTKIPFEDILDLKGDKIDV